MAAIHLIFQNGYDGSCSIPSVSDFELWIAHALDFVKAENRELCLRIVGETEMAELNQSYRGTPGPTNVLSFPAENLSEFGEDSLGDMLICAEMVHFEAQNQQKSTNDHWAHLTIHGTLHLLGYDHMDDIQAEEMEKLEIDILAGLNISNPYRASSE